MHNEEILNSWKDISEHLKREIRTCIRWEKEFGLPVHRIDKNSARSKVFAYKSEIDEWLKERPGTNQSTKNGFFKKRWLIIGSITVPVLLSTIFIAKRLSVSPANRVISIAVMPLKNLNPSERNDYFSQGVVREITNKLSIPQKIRVVPVFSVRESPINSTDIKKIKEKMGVDYILRGEIKIENPIVNLSVEFIRIKDGTTMWKSGFHEPLEDILNVPYVICSKIHETLKMSKEVIVPKYDINEDIAALDSYLKPNYILTRLKEGNNDPWKFYRQGEFYSGRFTLEANELAIGLFSQAMKIDPNFSLAYIGLANCYANYVNFNWKFDIIWLNKAEELIKKAQAINPGLPEYFSSFIEVYLLKGFCFSEDVEKPVFELVTEGIKRYPYHPRLNSITGSYYYMRFGRDGNEGDFKKALEFKEKSFWLNPYDLGNIVYAKLLMLGREFDKAVEICDILEKNDSSLKSKYLSGEILYYMGNRNRSRVIFKQLIDVSLEYRIGSLYYLAMISSREGDVNETKSIIQEINKISPEKFRFFENELKLSSIWAGLGEKELAYRYLRSFLNEKGKSDFFIYKKYIDIDANFDELKKENEFKKLLNLEGKANGEK